MPNGNSIDPARAKAQAMREAQMKADKRTRNIIISVVAVIVIALVAALALIIASQSKTATSATSGDSAASTIPAEFANGEPIVVSHLGVGQKDDSLPDITLNYSYTCHWCAYLESRIGKNLTDDAAAGKFNLILQPVNTAYMEFQGPATNAALQVAANDPEHFVAFHQALMTFANQAINIDSDPAVIKDLNASVAKVAELAKTAGVSDAVIAQFDDSATAYLEITNVAWMAADITGRTTGNVGTPELVFDNTLVPWGQGTGEEIYAQLTTELATMGLDLQ